MPGGLTDELLPDLAPRSTGCRPPASCLRCSSDSAELPSGRDLFAERHRASDARLSGSDDQKGDPSREQDQPGNDADHCGATAVVVWLVLVSRRLHEAATAPK